MVVAVVKEEDIDLPLFPSYFLGGTILVRRTQDRVVVFCIPAFNH
jgi:hypothetical protein